MFGKRIFIGNKTYAHYTGDGITLTKVDGISPKQEIFLDNDMINALDKFKAMIVHWLNEMQRRQQNAEIPR